MLTRVLVLLALAMGTAHAIETITVGSLTLTHCIGEYDGYCGSITQPLDRHGNLPGTITVGFEFYPHTDADTPSQGVIMAQEGGPGYSTTGSRDGYVRLLAPLRDHRDILLIDKRGTGRSSAIDCPALQRAYLPSQNDIAACGKQLGSAAWLYRSADAADDVAAVMQAAGGTYTITIGSNGGMPAAAGTLALNAAGATLDDTGILSLGTTFAIASGNFILDAGGVLDLSGTGASVSVAGTTSFASFAGSSAGRIKLTGSGATLTEIGNQTLSKRHAHDGQLYDR